MKSNKNKHNFNLLKDNIKIWALELGFPQIGISDIDLSTEKSRYLDWLEKKHQANMYYLENNLKKKFNPEELVKNTCRIISVILPYSPPPQNSSHPIASYALGTDYHKIIRKRLQQLASKIKSEVHDFEYRVFCDSAPILEKALAAKSGLGWIGKNNLLINPKYGSYFFLGEIYINLPLSIDDPIKNYCGNCTKCLQACPTKALIAANQLDAARCLSYQTIENKTEIPESFHELLNGKIFGCDECQKICPWNRFAKPTNDALLQPFLHFANLNINDAANWDEKTFLAKTINSPLRRLGYQRWQRNISVAGKQKPLRDM